MGWTYYRATYYKNGRIDRLAQCRAEFGNSPEWATVVKDAMVGTVYYAAMKSAKSDRIFALVVLTGTDRGDFGYKDMDESCGPCECSCPISILKLLSPTENEYAKDWRRRCYLDAEKRKEDARKLKTLKNAKCICVTLPEYYSGKYYSPGEKLVLEKHTQGRWVDWVKAVAFTQKDVIRCEYEILTERMHR